MKRLAQWIVIQYRIILIVFAVLTAVSAFLSVRVNVKYQLAEYLPPGAMSAAGYDRAARAFGLQGQMRVMAEDITVPEAAALKQAMAAVPGVDSVVWLDNFINISAPRMMWDAGIAGRHYRDGQALYDVTLAVSDHHPDAARILDELREVCGDGAAFTGSAVAVRDLRDTTSDEIGKIVFFLVPVLLILLFLSTGSWIEPPLFLTAIGAAILINMGTNAFLPGVSHITQSMIFALQMAVSVDYAIFLFHRFSEMRLEGRPVPEAMALALERSFLPLISCAATMIAGFLALCFMRFGLGADMGIVFAKGVMFSFLSVVLLLPALTVWLAPRIGGVRSKPLLPPFFGMGKLIVKLRWLLPVAVVLAVPALLATQNMPFVYGESAVTHSEGTRLGEDTARIEAVFGRHNPVVLLFPAGHSGCEAALSRDLAALPWVNTVQGIAAMAPSGVPRDFLPDTLRRRFETTEVSRVVIILDTPAEGEEAFTALDAILGLAERYYGDDFAVTGSTVVAADMRDAAPRDTFVLTFVTVAAVWLILLIAFRSLTMPFLLVGAIQFAVWIGLSFPYISGTPVSYLGYIIVSCVQLGATIDYAILFTHQYEDHRRRLTPELAIPRSVAAAAGPILTSAAILGLTGVIIRMFSATDAVSQIGILIGRGALLSAFMVLFILPQMLRVFDKAIRKTTMRRGG